MAKKTKVEKGTAKIASIIAWLVGVLVSLSVGAGMAVGTLNLRLLLIPLQVTMVAGWVVVVGTILSVVMALFDK
jgi:ABC-type transport system involved in Fe-S cluster assembly fused permease/ATPase subunit